MCVMEQWVCPCVYVCSGAVHGFATLHFLLHSTECVGGQRSDVSRFSFHTSPNDSAPHHYSYTIIHVYTMYIHTCIYMYIHTCTYIHVYTYMYIPAGTAPTTSTVACCRRCCWLSAISVCCMLTTRCGGEYHYNLPFEDQCQSPWCSSRLLSPDT